METELEEEGLDDLLLGLVVLALPHRKDDDGVHDHGRAVQTVRGVDLPRDATVRAIAAKRPRERIRSDTERPDVRCK